MSQEATVKNDSTTSAEVLQQVDELKKKYPWWYQQKGMTGSKGGWADTDH